MFRYTARACLAAVVLIGVNTTARAGMISGGPTTPNESGLGSYTGSITVTPSGANAATLTIVVTNTSPLANGGFLTGVAFNNPGPVTGAVLMSTTDADFSLEASPNNVNAAPFGQFDFGISTGGNFNGGGPPAQGLAVGASATFVVALTGTGVGSLTDLSFQSAFSVGPGIGGGAQFFTARFRGFIDGGSDKVAAVAGAAPPPVATPEPASAALALAGVGLAAGVRRLRRGRAAA
ncbi:MAG: hypothetical protein C0501_29010 [Isosphaera sp.]|nr:hypothetical protein [Isosphaera sp.]